MNNLKTGQFYGITNETIRLDGLTLTDTEYTHEKVDWHYHENAYFTFILEGRVVEGNKKETYHCDAGSLLFHNWQESHYNIKPNGFTRGFHIELEKDWLCKYEISNAGIQGSINFADPHAKMLMYNLFRESKLDQHNGALAIDVLLVELFSLMNNIQVTGDKKKPKWVDQIRELLNDTIEDLSLTDIAKTLNIHPVHLSRDFYKHFNCRLGDYRRALKIERALSLLPKADLSLTEIAFQCGFADQSHFIRSFKSLQHLSPLQYRRLL
ncbi:AraC family transcriptional regulator [Mucilaginibacter frigoritolerans]|uniref:AraC family transcriptional regulator n=1 Tax=Mucilaginibacter frigoritolerans TaxID=652788 RepID=A0A562U4H6_9SPHI|nr:AraC family transcriptional regulator [Mucilaginibacter frigoritolerans]TWJ00678.1 AraC family transcriptional regulator [Mucilaginibacter frigoritolerans]